MLHRAMYDHRKTVVFIRGTSFHLMLRLVGASVETVAVQRENRRARSRGRRKPGDAETARGAREGFKGRHKMERTCVRLSNNPLVR